MLWSVYSLKIKLFSCYKAPRQNLLFVSIQPIDIYIKQGGFAIAFYEFIGLKGADDLSRYRSERFTR